MEETYSIVKWNDNRFAISKDGNIIDTAQGYGYHSQTSARKAMWWKFKGGEQKSKENKSAYKKWINASPNRKSIEKKLQRLFECYFKEIAREETSVDEIWHEIEAEIGEPIPDWVRKEAMKG